MQTRLDDLALRKVISSDPRSLPADEPIALSYSRTINVLILDEDKLIGHLLLSVNGYF